MKKQLLSLAAGLFLCTTAFSQLSNNGFEAWTNMGTYDDPTGWGTLNGLSAFGDPISASMDTTHKEGDYSVRIESVTSTLFGGVLGLIYYSPDGATKAAYTERPISMDFYFKYAGMSGDNGVAQITFTKWDSQNNVAVQVGFGEVVLTDIGEFTFTSAPINYDLPDAPDSMQIIFSSTNLASGTEGSILHLDEVYLNMGNAGLTNLTKASAMIYPNPANTSFAIKSEEKINNVRILDFAGRTVLETSEVSLNNIDISKLTSGNYLVVLTDIKGNISHEKLTVQ